MLANEATKKLGLDSYDNCYAADIRVVVEYRDTCPYWIAGREYQMRTVLFGCGGYGEVTSHHPAASTQITEDVNGPYMCGRCHGTGIMSEIRRRATV